MFAARASSGTTVARRRIRRASSQPPARRTNAITLPAIQRPPITTAIVRASTPDTAAGAGPTAAVGSVIAAPLPGATAADLATGGPPRADVRAIGVTAARA